MNIELLDTIEFKQALQDYFYLINHHYPEKGVLKIVGDRYQLPSDLRAVLFRGITSALKAVMRNDRLVKDPDHYLIIDGYNILFTIMNYRLGRFVFISNDNICRDAGSLFGKIKDPDLFNECIELFVEFLGRFSNCQMVIYLDSPVSSSKKHKERIIQLMNKYHINGSAKVVRSPDHEIKEHAIGTYATSDSALIDATLNPVIDLPRLFFEYKYQAQLFHLHPKII